MRHFAFEELVDADLEVGCVYEGGFNGALAGEPISKLLQGVGNQGGIRIAGRSGSRKFVVLYTIWNDPNWPDSIGPDKSRLTYFGDNKVPGRLLHETGPGGNLLFEEVYNHLHAVEGGRSAIPPFFLFSRCGTTASSRSVRFDGLCAPGYPGVSEMEDLVAVWKTRDGQRYQNYKATFAILDVPLVTRAWIKDLQDARRTTSNAPDAWRAWVERGVYQLMPEGCAGGGKDDLRVVEP